MKSASPLADSFLPARPGHLMQAAESHRFHVPQMLLLAFCLLLSSCISSREKQVPIEAAKQEVRKRGWNEFRIKSVQRIKNGWRVGLEELPATPGGHAEVE